MNMDVKELEKKYEAALETVEKKKQTIERHKVQAAKKLAVLQENGWEANTNLYRGGVNHDAYWAVCEYNSKLNDIKEATKKLEEAQAIAQNWKNKLKSAANHEAFFHAIPEIFRGLQDSLVEEWNEWDKKKRARLQKEYEELGYKEFMKKYSYSEYEFRTTSDEQITKDNTRDAKNLIVDLYTRVVAITGDVTDWKQMTVSANALNGLVVGVKGTAKVESILAGGYNIQRLHIRVLVHEIKTQEVKKEEPKKEGLESLTRAELIEKMKEAKVKGWYKIYSKEDMIVALKKEA